MKLMNLFLPTETTLTGDKTSYNPAINFCILSLSLGKTRLFSWYMPLMLWFRFSSDSVPLTNSVKDHCPRKKKYYYIKCYGFSLNKADKFTLMLCKSRSLNRLIPSSHHRPVFRWWVQVWNESRTAVKL